MVTDPARLRLVLRNLFDNAVRHADQGGTVTIETTEAPDAVVFEVRNTGCDLAPDENEQVFERFWKHDSARSEGTEHCGLGLPLCRRIVEALDGSITVSIGDGTFLVRLTLPRQPKSD